MKKNNQKYLFLFIILLFAGLSILWIFRSANTMQFKKASFELSATKILDDFLQNEEQANSKYIGKTLIIYGLVREIDNKQNIIFLQTNDVFINVSCSMTSKQKIKIDSTIVNHHVRIKGECSGMLIDLNLNNCHLIEITD